MHACVCVSVRASVCMHVCECVYVRLMYTQRWNTIYGMFFFSLCANVNEPTDENLEEIGLNTHQELKCYWAGSCCQFAVHTPIAAWALTFLIDFEMFIFLLILFISISFDMICVRGMAANSNSSICSFTVCTRVCVCI